MGKFLNYYIPFESCLTVWVDIYMFWDSFKGRKLYFMKYLNKNVTRYMEQQPCVFPVRWMHSWEFPWRRQIAQSELGLVLVCRLSAWSSASPPRSSPWARQLPASPWGNKFFYTFEVLKTWYILNYAIWFWKPNAFLMFIFLSNFPDFCPHPYILLWGGGLQNLGLKPWFCSSQAAWVRQGPSTDILCHPHAMAHRFLEVSQQHSVALKAENHSVLRQKGL